MLWRFVREFPANTRNDRGYAAESPASSWASRSACRCRAVHRSTLIGWIGDSTMPAWLMTALRLARPGSSREEPTGRCSLAIAAPAIPFLLWKTRLEACDDRRRAMLFVGALAVGLAPFLMRGGCHAIRAGASGPTRCSRSVGSRPLRGARVDRAGYRLLRGGESRDGSAVARPDHAAVRLGAVRRLGCQPRAACLRGVRCPRKPRIDHQRSISNASDPPGLWRSPRWA